MEKLGLNKCFNKLVKTEWVTGIEIDEQREIEIQLWIVVHKRCIGCRKEDMRKLLSTLTDGLESQVDPDFFQDGNDVQKKRKNNNNEI